MEPRFQTLAILQAVPPVDEDNTLSIAGQTDYAETTSTAISERFFVNSLGLNKRVQNFTILMGLEIH